MTPLEQAAVAFVTMRAAAIDLRKKRNAIRCLIENPDGTLPENGYSSSGEPPCWKVQVQTSPDDFRELRPSEMCEPCQERDALTKQIPSARAKASGALRRLKRLASVAS